MHENLQPSSNLLEARNSVYTENPYVNFNVVSNIGRISLEEHATVDLPQQLHVLDTFKAKFSELENSREFSLLERKWRLTARSDGYVQGEVNFRPTVFSSDIESLYYNEISKNPLLTAEGEKYLSRLYTKSLFFDADDMVAAWSRRKLINSNLRLVYKIARRRPVKTTSSFLDHVQEGSKGLEHAVDLFDPELGYKFSTYANRWIRQAISRGSDNNSYSIKMPSKINYWYKTYTELLEPDGLNLDSSAQDIAKSLNITTDDALKFKVRAQMMQQTSLDKNFGDENSGTLYEVLPSKDSNDWDDIASLIHNFPDNVTEKERYILLRHVLGTDMPTLNTIANEIGIKRETAGLNKKSAIKKLNAHFTNIGINSDGSFDV